MNSFEELRIRGVAALGRIVPASFLVLVLSASLSAQSNTGRILGSVSDQSGGAVVGAAVAVTNTQTGVVRNLVTDQSGEYVAPDLLPGTYSVRAASSGFTTIDRKNILLETGKDIRIDLQLTPGEVTQTVEVTSAVPLVDTTGTTLGGTLSNDTINELPLNGRNYQNLLSLRPGVEVYPGGGSWTQSTNGIRPEDQNYMVDGLDNNEAFSAQSIINSPGTSGDAATILPIDAIQEFNVEENAGAEFGWKPGSVVNVSIKSGTNNLHGTAYAFGRDSAWDARNYFNSGPQTPVQLEQFGGTIGGHIVKSKLFYFAAYEELRYTVGNSFSLSIPTTASGVGANVSIPDAEAALAVNKVALNPLSLKLLPLYGSNSTPTNIVIGGFPNVNESRNVVGKVDYNINPHHTLSVSYFFGNDTLTSEDNVVTQSYFLTNAHVRAQAVAAHWTWTPNSRWVNEARFGINRYDRPVTVADDNVSATSYGINTGVTNPILGGFPQIKVSGLTQLGGASNDPNLRGPSTNYDFLDQLSYLRGRHAFKFGGEIRDGIVNQAAWSNGRGVFSFAGGIAFKGSTGLEDFLAGVPKTTTFAVGNPTRHLTQWGYAGFVQDDWRVTPRVTLNLGVRYQYSAPPEESNDLLGNWEPAVGLEQVGKQISSPYNGDHTNFAPRAGVAWDITGKGTTILRAGGGLMYELLPMNALINTNVNGAKGISTVPTGATVVLPNGTVQQGSGTIGTVAFSTKTVNWTVAGPVLPLSTGSIVCGSGGSTGNPCSIMSMNRNFRTPYVGTWALTLQHAFSSTLSSEVAYVGDHGDNLLGVWNLNQLNPQLPAEIACGHCEAIADRPYGVQYPYLQYIYQLTNLYRSNYSGLQASLTARNFHNMSFVVGYTYAHALDDDSHDFGANNPPNSLNPGTEYGPSDFDIRHRFTLSWTYNIPGKKTWGQLLEGWQINSIVSLQTGQPWNVYDANDDISRTGEFRDHWDLFGSPNDFKPTTTPFPFYAFASPKMPAKCVSEAAAIGATPSLQQYGCYAQGNSVLIPPPIGTFGTMGRNVFRDLGYRNMDLSVVKAWKFKERLTAQFRAEFFNVLNHPNFMNPYANSTTFTYNDPSTPGQFGCTCATPDVAALNPVLGTGGNRAIQLGLKLIY